MSNDDATVPRFGFGERLGLVFVVQSACLSALAVTGCLVYIGYSAITINRGASRKWSTSTHVHWYFLNLLISDMIQAIGGILSIKWIVEAGVQEGALCTAQGILKQMGDVGVALTSLTIALHTFCALVFRWRSPPTTALLVLLVIWIFIALIIGVSVATHKGQSYYGSTQYWCWITERYSVQRIVLEYLWMWVAAFINIIVYFFLALVVKGFIVMEGGRVRVPRMSDRVQIGFEASGGGKQSGAVAMQMLYYPAVYTITVFPVAVVRWLAFTGHEVPFSATAFASVLFAASGWLNVLLFKFTRPKILNQRSIEPLRSFRDSKTPISRDRRHPSDSLDAESFNSDEWRAPRRPSYSTPRSSPTTYLSQGDPRV